MKMLSSTSKRTRDAQLNIVYMFLIKVANISINLAYVPLLITALEQERYGVWLTITTIVSWIAFFDIGLGNGLRNKLAEAVALNKSEVAKTYVSTTYIAMGGGCLFLGLLFLLIVPNCNWISILNATKISNTELQMLMLWVLSSLVLQMFLKLINSILYALQKPALASLLLMLSQLLAFLGVLIYTQLNEHSSLLYLGIIISVAPTLVLLFASFFLFHGKLAPYAPSWSYFDKTKVREVLWLGAKFFWIQLTSLFLFQSNTLIIAHVSGSAEVAEYNIAYKYIGLIEMAFAIIAAPFWSATTEAYKREDWRWINNILKQLGWISIILVCGGIVLIVGADIAYSYWLGSALSPDKSLLAILLIFFAIQLTWIRYGSIINGIGYVKLQFYITVVEALIHIPLAFLLGSYWGSKGVVASLILVTVANLIWPRIQIKKIARHECGIWTK